MNKVHILMDPGIIPLDSLKEVIDDFSFHHKLSFIIEQHKKELYKDLSDLYKVVCYEDFTITSTERLPLESLSDYDNAIQTVLNDYRTFLIAERVRGLLNSESSFNSIEKIENTIYNFILFHNEFNFDELIFQATPHNLTNWVIAKTAESIGISVKMIQTSPIPWRFWLVEGLDVQRIIYPNTKQVVGNDQSNLIKQYIKMNQSGYSDALPDYEKDRLKARKGDYWQWKKELIDVSKSPRKLLNLKSKRKNYKLYSKLAEYPNNKDNYIVFFLHFQPERTSLPEAGIYSNQWLIIKAIQTCLPEGWQLYVKEHPSMFINKFDKRYRHADFYKNVSKLEKIKLIPLDTDTFNLIDNCKAIATITGTVGVQSLIRNKPVLSFGVASFRDHKMVYEINNTKQLKDALTALIKSNYLEFYTIETYLNNVAEKSVSRDVGDTDNFSFYTRKNRIEGHTKLMSNYFNHYSSQS